ncbi:MAG: hypothetical protein OQK76_10035 [Gammaproteobacteria bacterium]|nr:hypothetical protein [Gammaproteobacteria bacterium]MCW8910941.1 hypothetical protein [Gammaproteobacteria bacterium]MCW9006076.1 hypothetical protein [Gammaproteobacteria bacterium]MCW9056882.1 hypothetical protein [Gammaproteobacteria bacterium]
MVGKINNDDDFDAGDDDEMLDEFEEIDDEKIVEKVHSDARRRLEQLREDKELARLLKGDFDDWD